MATKQAQCVQETHVGCEGICVIGSGRRFGPLLQRFVPDQPLTK